MTDYSYVGAGKTYLRERGIGGGFIEIGNASKLEFEIDEDTKKQRDYTKGGGGTFNQVSIVTGCSISITMEELSPANIARALYGSTASVAETVVTDEVQMAYKDSFIPFDFMPKAGVSPVVTNAGGVVTYVEGTDYELRGGGIFIIDAGDIADNAAIEISYTKAATDVVQALVTSGKEFEFLFEGLNEARSGKRSRLRAFRVKLGPTKRLSMINTDYANLEISGEVLKDVTVTGTGKSQYFVDEIER